MPSANYPSQKTCGVVDAYCDLWLDSTFLSLVVAAAAVAVAAAAEAAAAAAASVALSAEAAADASLRGVRCLERNIFHYTTS